MTALKIGFFALGVHFDPLKLRFSQLVFYPITQNCMILMFYFIGIGHNVDINPTKRP
jgi:hypothetical protein